MIGQDNKQNSKQNSKKTKVKEEQEVGGDMSMLS